MRRTRGSFCSSVITAMRIRSCTMMGDVSSAMALRPSKPKSMLNTSPPERCGEGHGERLREVVHPFDEGEVARSAVAAGREHQVAPQIQWALRRCAQETEAEEPAPQNGKFALRIHDRYFLPFTSITPSVFTSTSPFASMVIFPPGARASGPSSLRC